MCPAAPTTTYDGHCKRRPIRRAASTAQTCADTKHLLDQEMRRGIRIPGELHVQLERGPVEVEPSCRHKRRPIRGAQDGPGEGLEGAERALAWGNAVRTWWTLCRRAHGAIGANGEIGHLGLTWALCALREPHSPWSKFVTRGEVDGEELEQPLSTLQSRRDGVSERPLVRGGPTWAVFCDAPFCVPRSRCCRRFESSAPPRLG